MDPNTKDVLVVLVGATMGVAGTLLGIVLGSRLKSREILTAERATAYSDFLVKLEEVEGLLEEVGEAGPTGGITRDHLELLREYRYAVAGQSARVQIISEPRVGADAIKAAAHVRSLYRMSRGTWRPSEDNRQWYWDGEVQGLRTAMTNFRLRAIEGRGLIKGGTTDEAIQAVHDRKQTLS